MNEHLRLARSLLATGALLGIVSCSGGASGVDTAGVAAAAIPAVTAVAPATQLGAVGTDAIERAALDVPQTSDVAAAGDALEPLEYGWTLSGSYSGILNAFASGREHEGAVSFDIDRTGSSFTGSGSGRSGQQDAAVSLTGSVAAEYPHSVAVDITLVSSSVLTGSSCTYTGTARRYAHVLLGVVRSADCGVAFFKVHPVRAQ